MSILLFLRRASLLCTKLYENITTTTTTSQMCILIQSTNVATISLILFCCSFVCLHAYLFVYCACHACCVCTEVASSFSGNRLARINLWCRQVFRFIVIRMFCFSSFTFFFKFDFYLLVAPSLFLSRIVRQTHVSVFFIFSM